MGSHGRRHACAYPFLRAYRKGQAVEAYPNLRGYFRLRPRKGGTGLAGVPISASRDTPGLTRGLASLERLDVLGDKGVGASGLSGPWALAEEHATVRFSARTVSKNWH